jgi:hypothetical protein
MPVSSPVPTTLLEASSDFFEEWSDLVAGSPNLSTLAESGVIV